MFSANRQISPVRFGDERMEKVLKQGIPPEELRYHVVLTKNQ